MDRRIALVTGGNRGIGFEVCRQLAKLDIHLVLTSRDENKGLEATRQLQNIGLPVTYHQLDVSDEVCIEDIKSHVEAEYNRLDVLVNNAGLHIDDRHKLLEMKADVFSRTMETNANGPLFLTQKFVPLMKENNYGRIVNVSSGIGELSDLGSRWPAYRLSKIMLNLQTRIFAMELAGTNVLINAMCPGWVRTDMGGASAPRSVEQGAETIVWLATLPEGGPQGGYFRDRKPIEW